MWIYGDTLVKQSHFGFLVSKSQRPRKEIVAGKKRSTKPTSAKLVALSSKEELELLSGIPSLDLSVRGDSGSSCWPRTTIVPLMEASSRVGFMLPGYIQMKTNASKLSTTSKPDNYHRQTNETIIITGLQEGLRKTTGFLSKIVHKFLNQ